MKNLFAFLKKKKEYVLVYSHRESFLEEQVTAKMAEGWMPQGGVSHVINTDGGTSGYRREELFYQAMVR